MANFYTVDRTSRLEENQIINLIRYNDVEPPELQSHVDEMFSHGVTFHGEHYFLKNSSQAKLASPNIEILFEYVRRSQYPYPHRPSRFQSFFACESVDVAKIFRERYGSSDASIWEVEAQDSFRADMNLLIIGNKSILVYSYFAHLYWRGETKSDPLWENLLVPPVKIVRRINE